MHLFLLRPRRLLIVDNLVVVNLFTRPLGSVKYYHYLCSVVIGETLAKGSTLQSQRVDSDLPY